MQNADDANATTMKLLYEGRAINIKEENENPSRKFLRVSDILLYKTF